MTGELFQFQLKKALTLFYQSESEYREKRASFFEKLAPASAERITIHELGRELPWRDPRESRNYPLGFGAHSLGLPPVAPNFESYLKSYREKDGQSIEQERESILRKIPGYDILDMDTIIQSKWGFIYAHEPYSLEKYFASFIKARQDYRDFASKAVTIFVTYGQDDKYVYDKTIEIGKQNRFNIFEYSNTYPGLRKIQDSQSNVTLIMDTGIPRKLFGQLFILSDDLPSLISGQDNLVNVMCVNAIMQGRVFFWEVLSFQHLAALELQIAAKKILGPETYQIFDQTMKANHESDYGILAKLFAMHDDYRGIYKELAGPLMREFDFATRISDLITKQWPAAVESQGLSRTGQENRPDLSAITSSRRIYLSIHKSA